MIKIFNLFFVFLTVSSRNTDWQDLILSTIPHLNYTGVSAQCTKETKLWLGSLELFLAESSVCMSGGKCNPKILKENLFAVQQLDSFGRLLQPGLLELSTTFEGSFQECEQISGVKYDTNYCYMSLLPKFHNPFSSLPFRSAVCMPRSCKHHDLPILYNQLGSKLFTARVAFCVHQDVEKDSAFWGFTVFMIVMVSIAILATTVDFLRESVYEKTSDQERNIALKILIAFSFWTNAGQVLSVKEQKPGFIKSLDCIRAFSMSWVIAGHALMYFLFSDALLPLSSVSKHIWNHLFLQAVLSVDTFFLLSGIVVAYLFFKQRPKPAVIKSPLTWILFYLHRYLRLTPPYMLFIGFFVVYSPYVQGPYNAWMWNAQNHEANACKSNWWRNLLYINNYDLNQMTTCYGVSWYLAVDTQLYILAPIVLIALYFSFAAGAITVVAGCVGSIITTYILYGVYDNMAADSYHDDASGEHNNVIYQRPWIRCIPYLLGLLTGYIIATYGKRQIRLNWAICVVCWLVAFGIGFACLFSNYDYDNGSYWSPFAKATFCNFSRLFWSIAVAWVIVANHFGFGGPINSFMSHPIWQPFGRLSYCAYIVHWMVLYYYLNVGDRPIHYFNTWQVYCYYAIPATILSYVAAFFWSCLFEVSTLKLEKMLIEAILSIGSGSGFGSPSNNATPKKPISDESSQSQNGVGKGHESWEIEPETDCSSLKL